MYIVFSIDPAVAHHLVHTGFRKGTYAKGDFIRNKYRPWLGDGIFTSDGEAWKKQRSFAKYLFHSTNMAEHVKVFHSVAQRLCERLEGLGASLSGGAEINMQDYCMRLGRKAEVRGCQMQAR